ncbi:MAG: response regulator [Proteobacteria bacterium]|nr:response regulator [Pseudomonadota bacterium]MBU4469594.1 response regulator [Pseudomonadota bacterium]MCG2753272.1 response regulator [Desulfobacteraceae bacterium]
MTLFNLLLVDDEKPLIEAMARRLVQRGFTVDCVFSGTEALAFLKNNASVDVVVLDVKMPGIDGIETLEAIKKQYPMLEVIMLTGHATVPSAVDAMKNGAFDYVMKPCDLEDLIAKAALATARKKDREDKIRDVKTMPYLTDKKREELIAKILEA